MGLKNRERFTTSLDSYLVKKLKELSKETRVPVSRLLDEAIENLLKEKKKGGD